MKNDECNSCNINKYKQHNPACVSREKKKIDCKRKHISM